MQDFYAIAVVPRTATDFCIKADLQRVFIFEPPLPVSDFSLPDDGSPASSTRIFNYLSRRYPPGTSVEELDLLIDIDSAAAAVVQRWHVDSMGALFDVSARYIPGKPVPVTVFYKTRAELWLETLRHEYETALATSPLERGWVASHPLSLVACQHLENEVVVLNLELTSGITLSAEEKWQLPSMVDFKPRSSTSAVSPTHSGRDQYRDAVLTWNTLDLQLTAQVSGLRPDNTKEFSFADSRILDYVLSAAANLTAEDPLNQSLDEVAGLFGLPSQLLGTLKAAGVNDLRTFATVVKFAPQIERQNRAREKSPGRGPQPQSSSRGCNSLYAFWLWLCGRRPPRGFEATPSGAESLPVTSRQAAELRTALGAALQARFDEARKQK
jgi:hypothetical protein